jgi:F0F1-type ATP synthase assembly protein I
MPIPVTCSGCAAKFNAPDAAAGKTLKCPKCGTAITVPATAKQPSKPAFEVVDDAPPTPAAKKPAPVPAKPAPKDDDIVEVEVMADDDVVEVDAVEDDKPRKGKSGRDKRDDDDDLPRKKTGKSASRDDNDDDDKPRKKSKRRDDDDDDDDRPRKKKKKAAAGNSSLTRNIIGGVVLVILLGVVVFVFKDKFGGSEDETANNDAKFQNQGPIPPPPGGTKQPPVPGIPGGIPNPKPKDKVDPQPNPKDKVNPPPNPKDQDPNAPKLAAATFAEPPVLSPDGKYLMAEQFTGSKFVVRVWDVQTGNHYATVGDGKMQISAFGMSHDNRKIAISSIEERNLTVWDVATGTLEKTTKLAPKPDLTPRPPFVSFTTDGKSIMTVFGRSFIHADVETRTSQVLELNVVMYACAYSAKANIFVDQGTNASTRRKEIRVYDVTRSRKRSIAPAEGLSLSDRMAISEDGTTVAVGATDPAFKKPMVVQIYDVATGKLKGKLSLSEDGSENPVLTNMQVSPDGKRVFVCYRTVKDNKSVVVYRVTDNTGKVIEGLGGETSADVYVTGFASASNPIAVVYTPNVAGVSIYNAKTDTLIKK